MKVPVKIEKAEYLELRALAEKRGQYLSFLLTEAVRQYIKSLKQKEQVA